MKKILILGSTGMLGHQVTKYFLQFKEYTVIDIAYRKKFRKETILLDVKNENLLSDIIINMNPDIIINCIGLLTVASNNDHMNAIYINSYFPHKLKNIAKNINAKMVHISTDCVFSGKKGRYTEYDATDGEDVYAKTKILGELIDNTNITIRTSLIGPEFHDSADNLFEWFMKQSGTINGFTNAIWSGVTTLELAKGIRWAIETDIHGLYHFTNNESINKYDLLHLFKKHTNKEIEIIATHGQKIDKSLINTKQELNYPIPTYDEMVSNMVSTLNQ